MRIRHTLLLLALVGPALSQATWPPESYFPLVPGTRWVYRLPSGLTYTEEVIGPRTFGGYRCVLVTRRLRNNVERFYYRWTKRGLEFVGRETGRSRRVFRPPVLLLRTPFADGARWHHRVDGTIVRTTTLRTNLRAGNGEHVRPAVLVTVKAAVGGRLRTFREVFAAGVGRVAREFLIRGTWKRVRLVRFEPARPARAR